MEIVLPRSGVPSGLQSDGRGTDKPPVWQDMVYDFMKKQWAAVPKALHLERYPDLAALDQYDSDGSAVPPGNNVVDHNICVVGEWLGTGWHAKPEMLESRENYVGIDPGFVNASERDFRLKESSPIWKTGSKRIPAGGIGLRDDQHRRALKHLEAAS